MTLINQLLTLPLWVCLLPELLLWCLYWNKDSSLKSRNMTLAILCPFSTTQRHFSGCSTAMKALMRREAFLSPEMLQGFESQVLTITSVQSVLTSLQ